MILTKVTYKCYSNSIAASKRKSKNGLREIVKNSEKIVEKQLDKLLGMRYTRYKYVGVKWAAGIGRKRNAEFIYIIVTSVAARKGISCLFAAKPYI